METTAFGRTGIEVTRLGVGLAEIRDADASRAGEVLNTALDSGINFLDTAACYGRSEELIGETVSGRRSEYTLVTKAGHATGDYSGPEWTGETVSHSIDRSLQRMRTDHVDLVQLHSCDIDVLERGEVIEALEAARDAGKTQFIGYSGDNENAMWAVESGRFDTLQTSFSLVDQRARTQNILQAADAAGMGTIIKRPIGNSVWGRDESPRTYADIYFQRARDMKAIGPIPGEPDDPILLAMGFTLAHPEVDTIILGTANPDHMRSNVSTFQAGVEIDPGVVEELHARFEKLDSDWRGRN